MSELDGIAEKAERDKQLLDDLEKFWKCWWGMPFRNRKEYNESLFRIAAALELEEEFKARIK